MYFDKGGRHYWFAKYLKKAGYNPVIFCANTVHNSDQIVDTKGESYIEIEDEINGIPFVFVKVPQYKGNGFSRLSNMFGFYQKMFKITRQYVKMHEKPDVIFASSVHPLTLIAGIKNARRYGIKCICEIRDLWPESIVAYGKLKETSLLAKILYRGEKWIYNNSDTLIFTVEGGKKYLCDKGWTKESGGQIDLNRVFYINNGIDIPLVEEQRKKYPYKDERFLAINNTKIVYAGSIRKVNHIGGILDVAKKLKDLPVTFCVFGDGDEKNDLEQRVQDEKIGNVIFFGKVEKKFIPSIMASADLLLLYSQIMPRISRYGMSQNKLFDYLAGGKPILSNQRNPYSIINKYECGIEKEFSDSESLARQIQELLNSEKTNKWGENSKKIAKIFSFEQHTKNLIEIIENT